MTPAIEAHDLTRRFGSFTAVDAISFRVAPGEVFGFLGANGAGKTTAMRMLTGLLAPTSGRASVAGHDVATDAESVKRAIGYMSQRFSLYEDLTPRENIRLYGGIYGLSDQAIRERSSPGSGSPAAPTSWFAPSRSAGSRSSPSRWRCCTSRASSSSTSPPAGWTRSRGDTSGR